jgi:hypothetical protein
MSECIFDNDNKLFVYNKEIGAYLINEHSGIERELHIDFFKLVGRFIGKALFDGQVNYFLCHILHL